MRGNRTLKGTQRCWRTLPHSIPKLPLEVLKLGIWAGPSTSVWPNHLRKIFSYFYVKVGLRVSILHPICIVVQLGRVIWVRKILHRESDVLWKVLSVVSVPFCGCPTLKSRGKYKGDIPAKRTTNWIGIWSPSFDSLSALKDNSTVTLEETTWWVMSELWCAHPVLSTVRRYILP